MARKTAKVIETVDPKIRALAAHLKVPVESIEEVRELLASGDASGEYAVFTEEEREAAADEQLENYIDECLLSELPKGIAETLGRYFDRSAWKRDAIMSDGYGPTLAPYDHEENEKKIDSVWFYIYRCN